MERSSPLVIVSASCERRVAFARRWLIEHHVARSLVLAPSRIAGDELVRGVEAIGLLGVERLTLGQLASSVAQADLAAEGRAPASELGSLALVTLAIKGALEGGALERLGRVADLPNFPRALRATLAELRLAGVSPEALESAGDGALGAAAQRRDLALLLRTYLAQLDARGLGDRALLLERAAAVLREPSLAVADAWCGLPNLWLEVTPRHQRERELLRALAAQARSLLLCVPAGDAHGRELARDLGANLLDLDDELPRRLLDRIQRYVFQTDAPPPESDAGASAAEQVDASLVFFSAGGEGQECVEIARKIRDLSLEGVAWDQVAIGLRHPASYQPLLIDALNRAGIEAHFARGTARPDPAGRAFLALLRCAHERFAARRFAEYLSLGQVPPLAADASPPLREVPWVEPEGDQFVLKSLIGAGELEAEPGPVVDGDGDLGPAPAGTLPTPLQWERLIVDAAVVGGERRWQRRLLGLEAELRRRSDEVGDEEPGRRAALERDLERLGRLRRFALPLIADLAALPASAPWGSWLASLEALAARALRAPDTVLRLLAELRPMADVGPVGLPEVLHTLADHLTELVSEPAGRRYGKVFVATIPELAGTTFSVVFLPGLAEGIFPRRTSEDPLLLDDQRRALALGLPDQDERVRQERLLLRLAAGAARDRLVVSYPRVDTVLGRARVPSLYALEVVRAARGAIPDLAELAREAEQASATRAGRPAPDRAELAIDQAELDLSLLGPELEDEQGGVRGRARFLLESPILARALRARARRWRRRFTYADGLVVESEHQPSTGDHRVDVAAVHSVLEAHRLSARSYSPTALQNYAACPYRFLLQAVLRLRPRLNVAGFEQLDPLTRGSIFHELQFELQGELRGRGLLPVRPETLAQALDRADEVVERVARRAEEELAPAIPRIWRSEIEALRTDLRGWLHQIAEAPGSWRPIHFELAFGLPLGPERDPASRPEPVVVNNGVLLRGSIDLVELLDSEDGERRYRVTDHKTGKKRALANLVVGGGEILQPVLYGLAAERLLDSRGGARISAGRLFYCTQRGGYEVVEVELDETARRAAAGVLEAVDGAIADGFLPAAPRADACRWCDYQLVCGPNEELRLERKDPERLAALVQLRSHR